jgi:hypothetical protein
VLSTPPAFILSQDQTLRKKIQKKQHHTQRKTRHGIIQSMASTIHHTGVRQTAINQSKNWHQQTWHTIEFSNNRHITSTHQETRNPGRIFAFLICGFISLDLLFFPVKPAFPRDFPVRIKIL